MTGDRIQPPARELVGLVLRWLPGGRGEGALEDDLHPGQQLPGIERLGQVVVGAHFEAEDTVRLVAPGREHDDRCLGGRPEIAAEVEAVLAREHEVEDDQVDPMGLQGLAHAASLFHRHHAIPVLLEVGGEERTDLGIVVDDEKFWLPVHTLFIPDRSDRRGANW